jgi:hypothetical protein
MPSSAETITIDSDAKTITINGVDSGGIFNGTPFTTSTANNVTTFSFAGDLDIPASSTVTGTGSLGIELYAANDVNVGAGVTFNLSANFATAGPGGGAGGGSGPAGGPGYGGAYGLGTSGGTHGGAGGIDAGGGDGQAGQHGVNLTTGWTGGGGGGGTDSNGTMGSDGINSGGQGGAIGAGGAGGPGQGGGAEGAQGAGGARGSGEGDGGQGGENGGAGGNGAGDTSGIYLPYYPYYIPGDTNADGSNGQPGGNGGINYTNTLLPTGDGMLITGGSGGGGGGGGGGGSGGGGGGGGDGGGGGGGGHGGTLEGGGDGSDGAAGNHGGQGGDGGAGGQGGVGGGGGGAFEIFAVGRINLNAGSTSLNAIGGQGGGGNNGTAGTAGSLGDNNGGGTNGGRASSGGSSFTYGGGGGSGGGGGAGGTGGTGGTGGNGNVGGGGAGGTIELFGSEVIADLALVNTSGGSDGNGTSPGPLSNGQFLVGSNVTTVTTTLQIAINNGVTPLTTTIQVASAANFPSSGNFVIQIDGEHMRVIGGQGTTTWTVVRDWGGTTTTASSYPVGDTVTYTISQPGQSHVYNPYNAGVGTTASNPYTDDNPNSSQPLNLATPVIVGLAGGAATYGLVTDPNLLAALNISGGQLANAIAGAQANPGTVALVLREQIPAGFDQYSGYDLVLFVNLTGVALSGPELGVVQDGTNAGFETALQAGGSAVLAAYGAPEQLGSLPAHGIFVTLIPPDAQVGNQYVNASISGSVTNISGTQLLDDIPHYITVPFGSVVGSQLPGLQAITVSPDGQNAYALSVVKNDLVVTNSDLSERTIMAVGGLTTASQIAISTNGSSVFVTEPGTNSVAVFSRFTSGGLHTSPNFLYPAGGVLGALAINPAENELAVADGNYELDIYTFNSSGTITGQTPVALNSEVANGITNLAFSQDGQYLYAINATSNTLDILDTSNLSGLPVAHFQGTLSGLVTETANGVSQGAINTTTNGLVGASAITVSPDDKDIYVTGAQGASLAVIQRSGNQFTMLPVLQDGVNGVRGLADANGVAVSNGSHANQYVYVLGGNANTLAAFAWQSNGQLLPAQVERGTQSLDNPGGIAVDASGTVYVTSQLGIGVNGGGIATFVPVPPIAITAASWSNNTATIAAANNFVLGQPVTIAGASGYDGTFAITSIIGPVGNQTGFTYALAANPGAVTLTSATVAPAANAYSVAFTAPSNAPLSALTLTVGNSDNTVGMIHDPSVAALYINAGNGSNLINLLDVPAPGQTPSNLTTTVNTGDGPNEVLIFADPANHTFNINTGDGANYVSLDGDATKNANNNFNVTLGNGNNTVQVAGDNLAASDGVNLIGGSGFNTLLYDADGQTITATLPDGTVALPGLAPVNYTNFGSVPDFVPPTDSAGGPYSTTEGKSLTLNGSATAATNTQLLGISWDLTGTGVYGDATDTSVTFPATSAVSKPTLTWAQLVSLGLAQAGTYTISMRVTTTDGAFYAYTTLVIDTAPPTITLNTSSPANVGTPYSVSFSATFPGDEVTSGWSISWGDHTTTTLPSDATTATHTYTAVGTYTVIASVTDANATYRSTGQQVVVGVNTNSLSAGGPYTINAGSSLTLTATAQGTPTTAEWDLLGNGTFIDPTPFVRNSNGTSTSTLTLTWTQLQAAGISQIQEYSSVLVEAFYPTSQVAAGLLKSVPTTLTVNDVAPTATLTGTAQEGGPGSVTFSNQASPVKTATFVYSYDFGNTGTFQVIDNANSTYAIPASYLDQSGTLVVRARITDNLGMYSESIITFPVVNQPPAFVNFDANKTVNENSVVSLNSVSFSDPGLNTISASINWGDNSSSPGEVTLTNNGSVPTTGTVSGRHTYAYRATPYAVTVTLRDDNGATAVRSFQVTVQDPPLTITTDPNQTVEEGETFNLGGTSFNDPGAPDTYTATVNWGDGSPTDAHAPIVAPLTSADFGRILDSHVYGLPGVYTVTATVQEPDQSAVSNTFSVTVTNVAPTVKAGADIPAGPGVPVQVSATFSDPGFPVGGASETYTATIYWGDNTTSPGTVTVTPGRAGVPTTGAVTGTHQYSGDGPYSVTVTVSDGGDSGSDTLLVTDAPPTVNPGPNLSGNEGSPLSLSATFSDAGFNFGGATKSFAATIDWGDGTSSSGSVTVVPGNAGTPTKGTVSASHVYTIFGSFPVTIHVQDEAGIVGLASLKASVSNLAPTIDPLPNGSYLAVIPYPFPPGSPLRGYPMVLNATFNDPGVGDTHLVTIDWGDGSPVQPIDAGSFYAAAGDGLLPEIVEPTTTSSGQLTIGHIYSDDLAHTVIVTVTDNGGLSAQASRVYASRPNITSITPPVPTEGITVSGAVATFADLGHAITDFTATILWGDGASSTVTSATGGIVQNPDGSFAVQAGHLYPDEATGLNFQVTVIDVNNANQDSQSGTVDVAEAPLTNGIVTATGGVENVTPTQLSATFTDANPLAPTSDYSGTINWGDGSTTTFTSSSVSGSNGSYTVSSSHRYGEEGVYSIKLTINDDGGSSTTDTGSTIVADAPLTKGTVAASGGIEGATATTLTANFTDANPKAPTSDFSGTINWGDGITTTFTSSAVSGSGGSYAVSASHQYAEDGTDGITVTINDAGSSSTTEMGTTKVADAALSATGGPNFSPSGGVPFNNQHVANFTDATPLGSFGDFTATVNWGDGNTSTGTVVLISHGTSSTTYNVVAGHTYALPGAYSIVTTVVDVGGSAATTSAMPTKATVLSGVLALNSSADATVNISGKGAINVTGTVQVDSSSTKALSESGQAKVTAGAIDVVGGDQISGQATNSPAPVLHAPSVADPLAGLTAPSPAVYGLTNKGAINLSGQSTLAIGPGIYTSITVSGPAALTLNPGIYVIAGGGLTISGQASVTGTAVMIYNAGSNFINNGASGGVFGAINVSGQGSLNLTPMNSGAYTGIVIFQSGYSTQSGVNTQPLNLSGQEVLPNGGLIYAPAALVTLSGNAALGKSSNTSLIVGTLTVSGNAVAQAATPIGDAAGAFTPAQSRTTYGINSVSWDGSGQTIAIVDAYGDPNIAQAVDAFDSQFGMTGAGMTLYGAYGPAQSFLTVLNQNGQATPLPAADPTGAWETETALDVEWAHAMAPGAKIILVEASSQALGDLMAGVVIAAQQPGVSVVSTSWGISVSQQEEAAYDRDFTTPAGRQPVTFLASAGDSTTAAPLYPAASPNVLSIGGTSLFLNADNSYRSETSWGYDSASAATPIVSFVADPNTGVWIADPSNPAGNNTWQIAGGTSLAAPSWAGLVAIIDQGRAAAGEAILGSTSGLIARQALYSMPAGDFHTLSIGIGYSAVAGRGSPRANRLVPDMIGYQATLAALPTGQKPPSAASATAPNQADGWTQLASAVLAQPVGGTLATVPEPLADSDSITTVILQNYPAIPAAVRYLGLANESDADMLSLLSDAHNSDANAAIDTIFSRLDELGLA